MYSCAFGWNVLKISMKSISCNVSFMACVSFCGANEIGSVGIPFVHNNISVFEPELDNKSNT